MRLWFDGGTSANLAQHWQISVSAFRKDKRSWFDCGHIFQCMSVTSLNKPSVPLLTHPLQNKKKVVMINLSQGVLRHTLRIFHIYCHILNRNDSGAVRLMLRQNGFSLRSCPHRFHFFPVDCDPPLDTNTPALHSVQPTGLSNTWDYSGSAYCRNVQHVLLIASQTSGACPQFLRITTRWHSLKAGEAQTCFGFQWSLGQRWENYPDCVLK